MIGGKLARLSGFSRLPGFPTMKLFQDVHNLPKTQVFFFFFNRDVVVPKKEVSQSFPFL